MLSGLDLPRVGGRDGRDLIREDDSALHQVQSTKMLDRVRRPVSAVQPERAELAMPADALVVEVVNRVDRARAAEVLAAAQARVKVDRKKGYVPVVRMNDIRCVAEDFAAADDSPAEKSEPLDPVVVSIEAFRVDVRAIEEIVVGDQYERDVGPGQCRSQVRRLG